MFLNATLLVVVLAVLVAIFKKDAGYGPWPECKSDTLKSFFQQLQGYYRGNDVAGYKELHGECAFSKTYAEARQLFLDTAKKVSSAKLGHYKVADGLYIDVVEVPGNPSNVLMSTSGVHGPEGFAGSGIQTSILSMMTQTQEMSALYADAAAKAAAYNSADSDADADAPTLEDLPPTLIFVHALNPYGFANNRRFNEDNIDLNRNFLTDNKFKEVNERDPNFAGYVDINFMINPTWMPFGTITVLNDIWGHLKSAYAVSRYGLTNIKRALVAGNYFRQDGLGFGGFTRSKSAELMIQIAKERNLQDAERIVLLDYHTGLGPPGTDTLALLGKNDVNFTTLIEKTFPKEIDGDIIVGGDKASDADGSAMSGYELTIGTMQHFCETWMHPSGDHTKDILCLTQEFGTVPVIEVGKAQIEENFAYHYGSEEQKQIYGERLKGVFYVQTEKWMRSVAHRGITLWMQAFRFISSEQQYVK